MGSFVRNILKNQKFYKEQLLLNEYASIDMFFSDLLNDVYDRIDKRNFLTESEVSNFIKYINKYYDRIDFNILIDDFIRICDRCTQLIGCVDKKNCDLLRRVYINISDIVNVYNIDSRKSELDKADISNFLNHVVFDCQDNCIFDIVNKSNKLYKYKYKDGETFINKALRYYKDSVKSNYFNNANYYSRLLFELLKLDKSKLHNIVSDLRNFKSSLNDKKKSSYILNLIDNLSILDSSSISNDDVNKKQKKVMYNYNIFDDFPDQLEGISDVRYSRFENLVDMRNKNVITIDNKLKSAFDDAISIEKTDYGYLFTIYITDVASFVDIDSSLYHCARKRSESIYSNYNNGFYVPMFPYDLTRNLFSLNSGSDRYVVAHSFKFSDSFDFIGHEFNNAIINVNRNYSYDEIDRMHCNDYNYDMVESLRDITDFLGKEFNSSYHKIKEKSGKHNYEDGIGANIICNSTVFLNSYIAKMFYDKNFPYIYRINEFPFMSNVNNDDLRKLINTYNSSSYSFVPKGHPINNGGVYGHITNPMRSFVSYLNQYIFEYIFVDWKVKNDIIRVIQFVDRLNDKLPIIVDGVNERIEKNKEFLSVLSELDSKRLTKKR